MNPPIPEVTILIHKATTNRREGVYELHIKRVGFDMGTLGGSCRGDELIIRTANVLRVDSFRFLSAQNQPFMGGRKADLALVQIQIFAQLPGVLQPAPVDAQCIEQLRTEHDVPVLASLDQHANLPSEAGDYRLEEETMRRARAKSRQCVLRKPRAASFFMRNVRNGGLE